MVGTLASSAASEESAVVMVDEQAWPSKAAAGSRFDQLFRSCYGQLYGLTYRLLGDRHEAEDVVQEAFLKLSQAAVLDRPDDEVQAWLRRVCLNAGRNRIRGNVRAATHVDRAGRLADSSSTGAPEPLPTVLREEEQRAVRRTLATLPDRQRACLLLRHSGHSYAEIASTLQMAIGSVGVLLSRAEKAFRTSYEKQESQR